MRSRLAIIATLICLPISALLAASPPWVVVAKDGDGFVLTPSGRSFIPWGFNYDRDYKFRLIEDYWGRRVGGGGAGFQGDEGTGCQRSAHPLAVYEVHGHAGQASLSYHGTGVDRNR
ncbi:hypothetical protein IH992_35310 [Candidatus Poribacteria bacterium]|nr:hypothetical protein [Candidatus Poribacteria bacterium]